MKIILILFLSTLFLGSCSSLSEKDCKAGNWAGIGERDGSQGHKNTRYLDHAKACQEYGVNPNVEDYKKGWTIGIKEFCTPENGFRYGKDGSNYRNSCPENLHKPFYTKYKIGHKIYQVKQEYDSNKSQMETLQRNLENTSIASARKEQAQKLHDLKKRNKVLKKKLIFLHAQAGYDIEEIVDYF